MDAKPPDQKLVLKASREGCLTDTNDARRTIQQEWKIELGKLVPDQILQYLSHTVTDDELTELKTEIGDRTYSLRIVPALDSGIINIYGTDIMVTQENQMILAQLREQTQQLEQQAKELILHNVF